MEYNNVKDIVTEILTYTYITEARGWEFYSAVIYIKRYILFGNYFYNKTGTLFIFLFINILKKTFIYFPSIKIGRSTGNILSTISWGCG